VELYVDGESIFSTEGTAKRDPMGIVLALIHKLDAYSITQI